MLAGDVEGIAPLRPPVKVRMIPRPAIPPSLARIHLHNGIDLQPAPQRVARPRLRIPGEFARDVNGAAKQPEKDENISDRDTIILEMPLRVTGLAEYRPPSRVARQAVSVWIGIQMSASRAGNTPANYLGELL